MPANTSERYACADEDVWQVRCVQCEIVADHLYARTGRPTGRTHVLVIETNETLCGVKNQWSETDAHPDLVTCLTCWTAWDAAGGTVSQHAAGLTTHLRPLPQPAIRQDTPPMRSAEEGTQ
jgi:hypothetical protein